ncbi:D-alanyl-D-alanine carboxypeptidase/D-alanyl-D-alanine-endopeptidase [Georgenia sp. AZ-5]|uniref:D-alanyl-D-alanine carboxypeptidase/D-alanyl-D-alanine endopeptidase n=1 Tax=Georgenia sp. AZ-5 TaxID=3367526 RepID=UPI003754A05C
MVGRAVGAAAAVVLVLGGYAVADAADVVPGVLTTRPTPADPLPFPDVELPAGAAAPPEAPGPDADAPVPTAAALAALAGDLRADERMAGSFGMVVADVLTGEVLLDDGGDTPRVPASSTKVLTAAAALDALGPESTLETTVVRSGRDVVLVGGGDVLLGAGDSDPDAVVGRAGLADLAAQTAASLREAGVTAVGVALDDTLFTGAPYAPDVTGADRNYVMPVQPVAVETGGAIGPGYVADPALEAAETFAAALGAEGVEVTGPVRRAAAPAGAPPLAAVSSAPVAELVRHMLKVSENSVAEVLARLVAIERGAAADFPGAAAAVPAQLGDLGIDVSGVTLVDGSGLSARNRIPPSVLVDVLVAGAGDAETLRGLVPGLPVGALDGTLADRLAGEAAGRVRAKTGTLIEALSLSGTVVTTDGRLLAFAVLTDAVPAGAGLGTRTALDAWAQAVAACGCS